MLTTLALLATLAAPDSGPAPLSQEELREANLELDAIAVMANPPQRQIVLSAVLCDAQARARDIRATIEGGQLSRALVRAEQSAVRDEEGARRELGTQLPLICTEWSVSRLVTCLDASAPWWCATDQHLAATLLAAGNLIQSWHLSQAAEELLLRWKPAAIGGVVTKARLDGGAKP
jgi:hypothetical protein